MTRYTTPTNTNVTTTKKLGEGGEGAVFDVAGQSGLVAKIYHPHRLNQSLAAKVIAMTRNPPEDATRASLNHVSIAWPIDVLYSGKQFVGYTMPKIKKADDLYDLLQPQQRAKQHGSLNHRHLYRTARNLAIAMDAIHQKGYVLGDVNFKNALFNDDALITIVDCDSMQVTDAAGVVHRCLVGVPEYTPADLQGVDFSQVSRTKNHDAFGLAVLIFQLLMQGFHPFAGKPRPGEQEVEQSHIYCISKGIFPYISNQPYEPPRAAPSMLCLPVLI
ncbi:MAG: protein kinase domain-containing protein, partial [Roseiflexaceae bacterium]